MAKKPNLTAVASLNMAVLAAIVAAGEAGTYGTEADLRPLAEAGLVEVNPEMTDANGGFAVRATAAGIAKAAPAPVAATSGFTIEAASADELAEAATKRRAGRSGGEKYPFDLLEVGQKFFVPATEKMPEPAKSLASTVSSATARYAVETEEKETVTQKTYATGEDGKRVKDADGHFIVESEAEVERPLMKQTRVFKLVAEENGAKVIRVA